ncbi:MAG: DinB family protein [Planctomycetaceae bacterium]
MSRSLGNVIADSLSLGLGYAEGLLAGVTDDNFAALANTGRTLIQSNHPAFIYGHLSLYAPQVVAHLGGDVSVVPTPDGFGSLFSKDATCQEDRDRKIYPAMDEVTTFFFDGYRAAADTLRSVDDSVLQQANPSGGGMAERFPTLGSLLNFYVGGHLMMHMGQMSAWRRMSGLGPA